MMECRSDITSKYPMFSNAKCGFEYLLKVKNIKNGVHAIGIRVITMDGKKSDIFTRKVNVIK